MKKLIVLVVSTVLIISTLIGCGKKEEINQTENTQKVINGYTVNTEYDVENLKTISGTEYIARENKATLLEKLNGMGITMTDAMLKEKLKEDSKIGGFVMPEAIGINYTTDKVRSMFPSEEKMKEMSQDEQIALWKEVAKYTVNLSAIIKIDPKNKDNVSWFENFKKKYDKIEELCEFNGYTFYFAYNDNIDKWELTEEEKTQVGGFVSELDTVKNNLCIFKEVSPEEKTVFSGSLSDFTGTTMSGKKVNQEIFKNYDITMVNIWATWCGACVKELPDIQKLYEKLPKNVNMISVCTDASLEPELAQSMIDDLGIKFETLIDNEEIKEEFYKHAEALPTTVFVDSKGNVVGDVQIGVPGEDVTEAYSKLIDNVLKIIGK